MLRNDCRTKKSLIADGCVSVALGLLLPNIDLAKTPALPERDGITQVLLYLNDHFKDDVTLISTVSELGFNASYLSRYFKGTYFLKTVHSLPTTIGFTIKPNLTISRLLS